jgi:hypothetical protein
MSAKPYIAARWIALNAFFRRDARATLRNLMLQISPD